MCGLLFFKEATHEAEYAYATHTLFAGCRSCEDGDGLRFTNPGGHQLVPKKMKEDQKMKTRYHRAAPSRRIVRDLHQAEAILRYRKWDSAMIRQHGWDYYRRQRYTVH
jgi:hypothetical protein